MINININKCMPTCFRLFPSSSFLFFPSFCVFDGFFEYIVTFPLLLFFLPPPFSRFLIHPAYSFSYYRQRHPLSNIRKPCLVFDYYAATKYFSKIMSRNNISPLIKAQVTRRGESFVVSACTYCILLGRKIGCCWRWYHFWTSIKPFIITNQRSNEASLLKCKHDLFIPLIVVITHRSVYTKKRKEKERRIHCQ